MSEDGGERRRRLQALREKATAKSKPTLKFRNYRPNDSTIKETLGGAAASADKPDSDKGAGEDRKDYTIVKSSRSCVRSDQCPTSCIFFVIFESRSRRDWLLHLTNWVSHNPWPVWLNLLRLCFAQRRALYLASVPCPRKKIVTGATPVASEPVGLCLPLCCRSILLLLCGCFACRIPYGCFATTVFRSAPSWARGPAVGRSY